MCEYCLTARGAHTLSEKTMLRFHSVISLLSQAEKSRFNREKEFFHPLSERGFGRVVCIKLPTGFFALNRHIFPILACLDTDRTLLKPAVVPSSRLQQMPPLCRIVPFRPVTAANSNGPACTVVSRIQMTLVAVSSYLRVPLLCSPLRNLVCTQRDRCASFSETAKESRIILYTLLLEIFSVPPYNK